MKKYLDIEKFIEHLKADLKLFYMVLPSSEYRQIACYVNRIINML